MEVAGVLDDQSLTNHPCLNGLRKTGAVLLNFGRLEIVAEGDARLFAGAVYGCLVSKLAPRSFRGAGQLVSQIASQMSAKVRLPQRDILDGVAASPWQISRQPQRFAH